MENLRDMRDVQSAPKRGRSPGSGTAAAPSSPPGLPTPASAKVKGGGKGAKVSRAGTPRDPATPTKVAKQQLAANQDDLFEDDAETFEEDTSPASTMPAADDADPLAGIPAPGTDEPLVAICRRYLTTGLPVEEVLKAFLRDRTIIGMCRRHAHLCRLSDAEAAELLHELGILFYTKLLPRLGDPEKVWAVCGLTAKRLAARAGRRIRESHLEDMGRASSGASSTGGFYAVDNGATKIADELLRDAAGDQSSESASIARIDKERAIAQLAALLQKPPKPVRAKAKKALDELRRSITFGPPGTPDPRLCDPQRTSPLVMRLFEPEGVMPLAPDDQPSRLQGVDRMPPSYGATLIAIRDELQMSRKDLAEALGISESACAQYEACAHGMPRHIYEEAVEIQAQGAPRLNQLRKIFGGMEMAAILARWKQLVSDASPGREITLVDIARIVDVNKSTASRWDKHNQRPPLERLGELEGKIQAWLSKRRATAA